MTETPEVQRLHLVTFLAALFACIGVALWMTGPYLLSLFLGGTMAMLCQPLHQWLLKARGVSASAAIITGLILLLVIVPVTAFSILAVRQGIDIGRELSELKEFSPRELTSVLSRSDTIRTVIGDPGAVNARIKSAIQSAGKFTGATVLELSKGIPEFLLQLALALIAFFFFLLDGERFMEWVLGLGVFDRNVQRRLVSAFRDTAITAVLAGLAATVSQATLIIMGFLVLDVPGAFLAGGVTFFFAWIPTLGSLPASLAGVLYLYAQGETTKVIFMLVLALAASVIDNIVRPLILKGRAGMHPLVGLVAIIGGIRMFGILGVFIGPIIAAMLLALLRIWPVIGGRLVVVPKATT